MTESEDYKDRICAQCECWEPGEYWGTGSGKHDTLVECKGWCLFKKDKNGNVVKRKRWNYSKACPNIDKRPMTGFMYQGGGGNTVEEDLANITELMKEMAEDNATQENKDK